MKYSFQCFKKIRLAFGVLFITYIQFNFVLAGNGIDSISKSKNIFIGINLSPDICFRILKSKNADQVNQLEVNGRNEKEAPKLGYTVGANVCFLTSKHWGFEFGLQYSNKGYNVRKEDINFGDIYDPIHGSIYTNSSDGFRKMQFTYNYHYLDIPFKVLFYAGKRKLLFVTGIGITTNIFLSGTLTSYIEYENSRVVKTTGTWPDHFNHIGISPLISSGVLYKFSSKANMRIEPYFSYSLTDLMNSKSFDPNSIAAITSTGTATFLWNSGFMITFGILIK